MTEWVSGDRSQIAQWDFDLTGQGSGPSKRDADAEPQWWNQAPHWHRKRPWPAAGYGSTTSSSCSDSSTGTISGSPITYRGSSTPLSSVHDSSTTTHNAGTTGSVTASQSVSTVRSSASSRTEASVSATSDRTTKISGKATSTGNGSSSSASPTATGTASAGGIAYHKLWRQIQQEFSEENQQASWGNWYYAVRSPFEPL